MSENLPEYPFPLGPEATPSSEYARLREKTPICRVRLQSGSTAWLLMQHDHVSEVLSDENFGRNLRVPGAPRMGTMTEYNEDDGRVFNLDPPESTRIRRLLSNVLSPRATRQHQGIIDSVIETAVRAIGTASQPVDLISHFTNVIPERVMFTLYGIPDSDTSMLRAALAGPAHHALDVVDDVTAVLRQLDDYFDKSFTSGSISQPGVLLSALLDGYADGRISRRELVQNASFTLFGGVELPRQMMHCGMYQILKNDQQLAECVSNPELWPQAVDEMLRYTMSVPGLPVRIASEDCTVGGVSIGARDGVIAQGFAANWDPTQFPQPEVFDIHRNNRNHLAFGRGAHFCLGANLGRAMMLSSFRTLFVKFPHLRLSQPWNKVTWIPNLQNIQPERLDAHVRP